MNDLKNSDWENSDVITFSGSGEPTLAKNLGEVIASIKAFTGTPVIVLTNSTLLNMEEVRDELKQADKIFCKLDAWTDDVLRRVDRPKKGISLKSIISGIKLLRDEFSGFMAIQTMILRTPKSFELKRFAEILHCLNPDEVQLNTPARPIPQEYFVETRGNLNELDEGFTKLKTISKSDLEAIRQKLSEHTHLPIIVR
jgi:wyosine [tRNA(Phe)-imidazoG37] synthetase (radical SAM superfamily)